MIGEISAATANTRKSFVVDSNESSFLALAAKVFWGSMPARTVAIVACGPREGTTFVGSALEAFLSDEGKTTVSLVSAEAFLASASDRSSVDHWDPASNQRATTAGDEIVLIDCPALFFSSFAIRLSPRVDGFLLVIEDGARSKSEVQRAAGMIEAAEGRILGIVLNKRRYLLPDWLYSLLS
jgi:hypothetical protein